jgi:hypothetical protein
MTGADLAAWAKDCRWRTQTDAARALRLCLAAYRNKLKGTSPVDERTELLCSFWRLHLIQFERFSIASVHAIETLAELTQSDLALDAARRGLAALTKLANGNVNGKTASSK